MGEQIVFFLCVFGLVALPAYWLTWLVMHRKQARLRERLAGAGPAAPRRAKPQSGVSSMLKQVGQAAAKPLMPTNPEEQSKLRLQCGYAGFYSESAARMLIGTKAMLLLLGLAVGYGLGMLLNYPLIGLGMGGPIGYMVPTMWLKLRIHRRRQALEQGLPDALDLMVVCVESGLTVDASMQRVGHEISLAHPPLAQELDMLHLETQVGIARGEALRNLAQRTGSEGLQSLVAMLIQAERFGTSIATALRVHGESLRVKRQHQAEEHAAKAAVKLSFPLVLFIFPALLIVVAGPAIISLMQSGLFSK